MQELLVVSRSCNDTAAYNTIARRVKEKLLSTSLYLFGLTG
ncbi:hypothetical protein [Sulfurimonas sp.]|nr:hypothetical protein [Sulfurimonas sp.]